MIEHLTPLYLSSAIWRLSVLVRAEIVWNILLWEGFTQILTYMDFRFSRIHLKNILEIDGVDKTRSNVKGFGQRLGLSQGGKTWQAFGGGKNAHETFCQARIYNFRDKCVIFARNLKFSNLTQ